MANKGIPVSLVSDSVLTPITSQDAPYYLPAASGAAVPAAVTSWILKIDQSLIPADQQYEMEVEYQYAGIWQLDAGAVFSGGKITHKDGSTTFINHLTSTLGAIDSKGQRVGPYPDNVRVKIKQMGTWILPTVSFTFN